MLALALCPAGSTSWVVSGDGGAPWRVIVKLTSEGSSEPTDTCEWSVISLLCSGCSNAWVTSSIRSSSWSLCFLFLSEVGGGDSPLVGAGVAPSERLMTWPSARFLVDSAADSTAENNSRDGNLSCDLRSLLALSVTVPTTELRDFRSLSVFCLTGRIEKSRKRGGGGNSQESSVPSVQNLCSDCSFLRLLQNSALDLFLFLFLAYHDLPFHLALEFLRFVSVVNFITLMSN